MKENDELRILIELDSIPSPPEIICIHCGTGLSYGSYMPSAVLQVDIPKKGGGVRPLGIPTVTDRIAQMVVTMGPEPKLDRIFLKDLYGYRPNKSEKEAVGITRQRCGKYDGVLDHDIKGFFDNIPHDLLIKAVRKHTSCKWILPYIERWLKTPVKKSDGTLAERTKGTPQGTVISPLPANLFLHYFMDELTVTDKISRLYVREICR